MLNGTGGLHKYFVHSNSIQEPRKRKEIFKSFNDNYNRLTKLIGY